MDTIWTAGVRRGRLAARAHGRREGGRARRRARRTDGVGAVGGQDLRDPAEHQRPTAVVPQGPRAQAARDLGRDDRDGEEAPSRPRATSSSRARSTRATSSGSTTSSPRPAGRSSTPRASPTLDDTAVKAAQIIKDVATSGRLRPVAVDDAGGPGAARVRGGQGRLPAQLALRLRRRARRCRDKTDPMAKKVFENMGYARWPGVNKGEPSKVSIGGANLGIPNTGQQPGARHAGRAVHDEREVAGPGSDQRGPAARHELDLRRPRRSARSTRSPTCCASSSRTRCVRPATPSYSDVTLAIQYSLHPPAGVEPESFDQHAA